MIIRWMRKLFGKSERKETSAANQTLDPAIRQHWGSYREEAPRWRPIAFATIGKSIRVAYKDEMSFRETVVFCDFVWEDDKSYMLRWRSNSDKIIVQKSNVLNNDFTEV